MDNSRLPPFGPFLQLPIGSSPIRNQAIKTPQLSPTKGGKGVIAPSNDGHCVVGSLAINGQPTHAAMGLTTPFRFSHGSPDTRSATPRKTTFPSIYDATGIHKTKREMVTNSPTRLLSSPFAKLGKENASSSRELQESYTYDMIFGANKSSQGNTTVGPYEMEIRPSAFKRFDGGSNQYNSSFLANKKQSSSQPFVFTNGSPMRSPQLLLSDDITIKFDTSFPDPKPIHDLFALDENIPSSAPTTAGIIHGLPSNTTYPQPPSSADSKVLNPGITSYAYHGAGQGDILKAPTFISGSSQFDSSSLPPPSSDKPMFKAMTVSLPPISDIMNSPEVSGMTNEKQHGTLSMRLRNRKPMDYNINHHTSLSQVSNVSSSSSDTSYNNNRPQIARKKLPRPAGKSPTAYVNRPIKRRVFLASRSKNGCWTCRIRKKKCTEEKPSCLQCSKLGLKCDGYSDKRPEFMESQTSQRLRLDQIKEQTSKNKKVGVRKHW